MELFDTLACNLTEISQSTVLKMLLRCKYMLVVRAEILTIFKKMRRRARFQKALNYLLVRGDQIGNHNIQHKW